MEDDELRAARLRDAGGVVEHAHGAPVLRLPLDVPEEGGERRVDREHDVAVGCALAEMRGERLVHPEAALEIELAGVVAPREEKLHRRLRRVPARQSGRPDTDRSHPEPTIRRGGRGSVRSPRYVLRMPRRPSRIELLELDIDLRLTDLWAEAAEVDEWNLDVVAALMRAAYGKGYCDALTEDEPGSLCRDHGYVVPDRRPSRAA